MLLAAMSNASFWNDRYKKKEYAYGKEPNVFFTEALKKFTPGKLLLPCEGEGRNAVAAAIAGWEVHAFDISEEGRKKALNLASENQVDIFYSISEIEQLDLKKNSFDAVALIYAHMPTDKRSLFHQQAISLLKPGGWLILEGFHSKQLGNPSGGPQQLDMLFNEKMLREDFNLLKIEHLVDLEVSLNEGIYHKGKAHVIRLLAQKM